jgi:hypothetical protein
VPIGIRKRIRLIPGLAWLNASKSGVSTSIRLWPFTWNSRRGWSCDLPGPLYWRQNRKGKGPR